jgi:hypothetical protein
MFAPDDVPASLFGAGGPPVAKAFRSAPALGGGGRAGEGTGRHTRRGTADGAVVLATPGSFGDANPGGATSDASGATADADDDGDGTLLAVTAGGKGTRARSASRPELLAAAVLGQARPSAPNLVGRNRSSSSGGSGSGNPGSNLNLGVLEQRVRAHHQRLGGTTRAGGGSPADASFRSPDGRRRSASASGLRSPCKRACKSPSSAQRRTTLSVVREAKRLRRCDVSVQIEDAVEVPRAPKPGRSERLAALTGRLVSCVKPPTFWVYKVLVMYSDCRVDRVLLVEPCRAV